MKSIFWSVRTHCFRMMWNIMIWVWWLRMSSTVLVLPSERKCWKKGKRLDFLFDECNTDSPYAGDFPVWRYGCVHDSGASQGALYGYDKADIQPFHESDSGAVLEKIDEGDQCYVVCPAIEKNEDMEYAQRGRKFMTGLCASLGRRYRIALLHGK